MSSSSSKSYGEPRPYDVFLSFRGIDTRNTFTSHLHAALTKSKIKTFMDTKLEKGTELRPELLRAIEGSMISIVVFSVRCAGSKWCLDELAKIMECHRTFGQVVLPVFYHVDPSDVRHQKGAFGDEFITLLGNHSGATQVCEDGWRKALTDAANFSGWHVKQDDCESGAIQMIVEAVLEKLDNKLLPLPDFPVGLESRVQDLIQLLKGQSSTVYVLGIWGMGGSGKTTLAKAIYNQIHDDFVYTSFLEDVRETWETNRGQIDLQEQLLCDILKLKRMKMHNIEWGKAKIKKILSETRALIVLDDVNKDEQLQALCGNRTWIRPGSVVIITTRDVRVLKVLKPNHVHEMKKMDEDECLKLFSWHAFREERPREDFIELSSKVVNYCGGLPLALEVLGSHLLERTKQEWRSVLLKLEMIPNDRVQEKLRISFDGLRDHMEKDIFLDICCFFIGKSRAYVTDVLDGCGLHAEIGISILIERSLIQLEKNNKLGMHDLLRDMGREIIRERSPKEPEKQSRLWFHEDVIEVLTEHTGTKAIEGLALKLPRSSKLCFSTNAFEKMKKLRLLQFNQVQLEGDYSYLPKHLRWVDWQGFSLKYIPDNFDQGNLVGIDLRYSNLKLVWKEPQVLEKLKILNLSHSRYLTHTPNFSKLPNLEKLILKDCPSLFEVHLSIGDHSNLLLINLKECTSLRNLPRTFYSSKSLRTIIISGCSNINKLEEDIVQMESLTTLIAKNTAIKQIPFSIIRSQSIGYISLCGYEGLSCDVFPSLIWSWMSPTLNPQRFILFGGLSSSLVSMDMHSKNLGDLSSMLSGMSKLRSVWVQCDPEFQLIEDFRRILNDQLSINITKLETSYFSTHSLGSLLVGMGSYHQVIDSLSNSISQGLTASGSVDIFFPSDNYPCWSTHIGEGHSVLFEVPQVGDCYLKGMILGVVYSSIPENMVDECLVSVFIVNYTKCLVQLYKRETIVSLHDEEWQRIVSELEPHDKIEIFATLEHGLTIKKTALYLIYGESINEKMEASLELMTPAAMLSLPDRKESMPPVTVLSEADQKEQMPPVTMLSESDPKELMPPDPVLSEPDQKELMPPDTVLSEPDPKELMPPVSVVEPDQKELMPSVTVLSEPDPKDLMPIVGARPEGANATCHNVVRTRSEGANAT